MGQYAFHNGTSHIGPEPDYDFEDSATVTWTLTDDPTNRRLKVSAAAAGGGLTTYSKGLASDYLATSSWADTGLSPLPIAATGTYRFFVQVSGYIAMTENWTPPNTPNPAVLMARLYDGGVIAGSRVVVVISDTPNAGVPRYGTATIVVDYVVTSTPATIELQAAIINYGITGLGKITKSGSADPYGDTYFTWLKIA